MTVYSHIQPRQNPAVLSSPDKVFMYILQALEAETLQGATATKVVASAKQLVAATGINADQIFGSLNPDTQMSVRRYFE